MTWLEHPPKKTVSIKGILRELGSHLRKREIIHVLNSGYGIAVDCHVGEWGGFQPRRAIPVHGKDWIVASDPIAAEEPIVGYWGKPMT